MLPQVLVFQIAFLSGMTAGLVNLLRMVTLKILYPRVRLFVCSKWTYRKDFCYTDYFVSLFITLV